MSVGYVSDLLIKFILQVVFQLLIIKIYKTIDDNSEVVEKYFNAILTEDFSETTPEDKVIF